MLPTVQVAQQIGHTPVRVPKPRVEKDPLKSDNKGMGMQKGFSLLEMLIVFSIIGTITAMGVTSFFSYSQRQTYTTAVSEVEHLLQLAKTRALSRTKPPQCGTEALQGYQVTFAPSGTAYTLEVVCGASSVHILQSKNLPDNITFAAGSVALIHFAVSTGIVNSAPRTVTITGYDKSNTITVDSTGNIALE